MMTIRNVYMSNPTVKIFHELRLLLPLFALQIFIGFIHLSIFKSVFYTIFTDLVPASGFDLHEQVCQSGFRQ